MVMRYRRNGFPADFKVFASLLLLLLLLGGCATPKHTISEITTFSDDTTPLIAGIQKTYVLTQPFYQQQQAIYLKKNFNKFNLLDKDFGIPDSGQNAGPPSFPVDSVMKRIIALQCLQLYTTSLKAIMTSTTITEIQTNIPLLGTAIDNLKATPQIASVGGVPQIAAKEILTAASTVIGRGLELYRNAVVKETIALADPVIQQLAKSLQGEIGSCSVLNKTTEGQIASVVYGSCLTQLLLDKKLLDGQVNAKKNDDPLKAITSLIGEKNQCETICNTITLLTSTIGTFAKAHALLPTAFKSHRSDLRDTLAILTQQTTLVSSLLDKIEKYGK
jgi:hypothetical protein